MDINIGLVGKLLGVGVALAGVGLLAFADTLVPILCGNKEVFAIVLLVAGGLLFYRSK